MNDLTQEQQVRKLLKTLRISPKHLLGQNFLVDQEVLGKIVDAADLSKDDYVLEVGPGLGVLTKELASRAKTVLAVEKDPDMANALRTQTHNLKNLIVKQADALKLNLEHLPKYKVVANIPYYLTSHLLQILLTTKNRPELIVLLVQKEVSERAVAKPGNMSLLGLSVQMFAKAEIVAQVSRHSFWPSPKVDSAILKLVPQENYPEVTDQKFFFRLLKVAFAGKRKQIHNTLASGLHLNKHQTHKLLQASGIDPTIRPQDLKIGDWVRLYEQVISQQL